MDCIFGCRGNRRTAAELNEISPHLRARERSPARRGLLLKEESNYTRRDRGGARRTVGTAELEWYETRGQPGAGGGGGHSAHRV